MSRFNKKVQAAIVAETAELAEIIGGEFKTSKNKVPMIVKVGSRGVKYSICYFKTINLWRVFWPYPSLNKTQRKESYKKEELLKIIKEREAKA